VLRPPPWVYVVWALIVAGGYVVILNNLDVVAFAAFAAFGVIGVARREHARIEVNEDSVCGPSSSWLAWTRGCIAFDDLDRARCRHTLVRTIKLYSRDGSYVVVSGLSRASKLELLRRLDLRSLMKASDAA
jgi:hypothetical protein